MDLVVYIDVFFCVNFGMNLVILILLKYVSKLKSSIPRMVLASIVGGLGACSSVVFPGMNLIIKFIFLYVIISMVMVAIAFPVHNMRELMRNVIKLYIVSFFVGGIFHFLYYTVNDYIKERVGNRIYENASFQLLLAGGILLSLCIPVMISVFRNMKKTLTVIYKVELWENGKSIQGLGLYDTGNSLRDPLSGKPVIIAEYNAVKELLSQELQNDIQSFYRVNVPAESVSKLKWIPYHSLGKDHGFLPGLVFQMMRVEIDGKKQEAEQVLVGIYQGSLSAGKEYQFILHEEYLSTN